MTTFQNYFVRKQKQIIQTIFEKKIVDTLLFSSWLVALQGKRLLKTAILLMKEL